MVDNAVIKRPPSYKTKKQEEEENFNIYVLDKAYNSEPQKQELIKRGYVLHISPKRKREVKEEQEAKITVQHFSNRKSILQKDGL